MKKLFLFTFFSLILSQSLFSEEHLLTNLSGGKVDLKSYDHALAGSVKDFIIFANKNEQTSITTFMAKKDGQIITAEIKKKLNGMFGTSFSYLDKDMVEKEINIDLKNLDRDQNIYHFEVNGQSATISVVSDDFQNNHFINPTYSFKFNQESFTLKMDRGQACYNFSAHIIAIILTAYSI